MCYIYTTDYLAVYKNEIMNTAGVKDETNKDHMVESKPVSGSQMPYVFFHLSFLGPNLQVLVCI